MLLLLNFDVIKISLKSIKFVESVGNFMS